MVTSKYMENNKLGEYIVLYFNYKIIINCKALGKLKNASSNILSFLEKKYTKESNFLK